jgi:hypothetical protein
MIPNGILRNIPIIVVREKISPLKDKFPVTPFTNIEKIGEVIPQPKVYMKNVIEIGYITLLKLAMCCSSLNSLNIRFHHNSMPDNILIRAYTLGKVRIEMPETTVILEINEQHFMVRLYETMLEIDLTGSIRNEIVEALKNKPILRETMGTTLGMFVPLRIRISDIDSVQTEETGKVRIVLSHDRDIIIPLQPDEAEKLVSKL